MTSDEKVRVYDAISSVVKKANDEHVDMGRALTGNNYGATKALFLARLASVFNVATLTAAGCFGVCFILKLMTTPEGCFGIALSPTSALLCGVVLLIALLMLYLTNIRLFSYRLTAKTARAFILLNLLFGIIFAAIAGQYMLVSKMVINAIALMIPPVLAVCYGYLALVHWPSYEEWFDSTAKTVLKNKK